MENKIYKQDNGYFLTSTFLVSSIFSPLQKNDLNNYHSKNKELISTIRNINVSIRGYQPDADIDLKLFLILIKENSYEFTISIDSIIKQIKPEQKYIQKRDRDQILNRIERLRDTSIRVNKKGSIIDFSLIPMFSYSEETKELYFNLESVAKIYKEDTFIKYISFENINNLNQYETSLFLLVKSQNEILYVKTEDAFNRLRLNDKNFNDRKKRSIVKKSLETLKELKLIRGFEIKETSYIVFNYVSKDRETLNILIDQCNGDKNKAKEMLSSYKKKKAMEKKKEEQRLNDLNKNYPPLSMYTIV